MSGMSAAHQRQSNKNRAARLTRRACKKTEINRTKKMLKDAREALAKRLIAEVLAEEPNSPEQATFCNQ